MAKKLLMEAAIKTNVLPNSVLLNILAAKPDELRKVDLMEYLENKDQPLPDYMIAILRQMSNGTSAKTALLNQKAQYFKVKTKAAQKMILSIKNEEELDIIALRNWLGNLESLEADKQVVATYLYEDDYANANALLDLMPDLYNLEGDQLIEFNVYVDLLNPQIGLKQQNRNIFMLTESEKSQLLDFAENSTGDARNGARSILSFVYGNKYCDCITPIEGGGNKSLHTSYVHSDEDVAKALGFSIIVKPNPVSIYASVDYTLPIELTSNEINTLTSLYENSQNKASVYARNLLLAAAEIDYEAPVIYPDFGNKSALITTTANSNTGKNNVAHIDVYPNPARDYIIFEYDIAASFDNAHIYIYNSAKGTLVMQKDLTEKQNALTIDTKEWAIGTYLVSILVNGEIVNSTKFNVVNK